MFSEPDKLSLKGSKLSRPSKPLRGFEDRRRFEPSKLLVSVRLRHPGGQLSASPRVASSGPKSTATSRLSGSSPPPFSILCVKREAIEAAGDLKDSILYESHVPPDDKNQDLIRVASPLITPITPTNHLKQAPRTHAASANHCRQAHEPHRGQMYGQKPA